MPFGLNIAPLVFTRLMRTALKPLRRDGIRLVAYLDDILIISESKEQAVENSRKTVQWLQQLGFLINSKKSNLCPSQKMEFLGRHRYDRDEPKCSEVEDIEDSTGGPPNVAQRQLACTKIGSHDRVNEFNLQSHVPGNAHDQIFTGEPNRVLKVEWKQLGHDEGEVVGRPRKRNSDGGQRKSKITTDVHSKHPPR